MSVQSPVRATAGVGPLLQGWRQRRRRSQLDVAIGAEVSARHLSFIETDRAKPSRELILHLAELAIESFCPADAATAAALSGAPSASLPND